MVTKYQSCWNCISSLPWVNVNNLEIVLGWKETLENVHFLKNMELRANWYSNLHQVGDIFLCMYRENNWR
jgi:hypothetical protein